MISSYWDRPPKIIKKGESLLVWGSYLNGRPWCVRTCVLCGKEQKIIGTTAGNHHFAYSKYTRIKVGHLIEWYPTRASKMLKKGWDYGAKRKSLISDWCTACNNIIRSRVQPTNIKQLVHLANYSTVEDAKFFMNLHKEEQVRRHLKGNPPNCPKCQGKTIWKGNCSRTRRIVVKCYKCLRCSTLDRYT
jgi:hypothetical protein